MMIEPDRSPFRSSDRQPTDEDLQRIQGLVVGCHHRLGRPLSPEDLEECIQEASLAALRQRGSFRGDSDIDTWLYGIARITILRTLGQRQTRRYRQKPLEVPEDTPDRKTAGPGTLADTGVVRSVRGMLGDLGTTLHRIMVLRDMDGMSFTKIATELGMNETTVKSRYYRALPGIKGRLLELWKTVRR